MLGKTVVFHYENKRNKSSYAYLLHIMKCILQQDLNIKENSKVKEVLM